MIGNLAVRDEFPLFRYLATTNFATLIVVLLVSTVAMGWLLRMHTVIGAESQTLALTGFLRDDALDTLLGEDGGLRIPAGADFSDFDERMSGVLEPLRVVKIKVYATDMSIVYSTDHSIIGETNAHNSDLMLALSGTAVSRFRRPDDIWDLDSESRNGDKIVETYVPIRNADNQVVGCFEIYADISPVLSQHSSAGGQAFLLMAAIFLGGGAAHLFHMRRAAREVAKGGETGDLGTLAGLLPICASCKKIRDDDGAWSQIEEFISHRSRAEFTHSICPECSKSLYPDRHREIYPELQGE